MAEVEPALALGQIGEGGVDGVRLGAEQQGSGASDGDEGCALLAFSVSR